jgi:hypothetical protein
MKTASLTLALLAALGGPVAAQELARLGLDDASGLGLTIEADTTAKVEGQASLKIATRWPTTICLGEVEAPPIEAGRLIYRAKVKTDLHEGRAFLEMWVHVGGGRYFSKSLNHAVGGTTNWQSVETPFLFQPGQSPDKVTLNLVIEGIGTVWIDDISLSKESLP